MKWRLIGILISINILTGIASQISVSQPPSDPDDSSFTLEEYVRGMTKQVNENLVFSYLDHLMDIGPRYTGTMGCDQAAYYLYNEFTKMGLWTQFHPWEFWGYKSANVVATLNGTDPLSDGIIIFSAHYDTTEGSLGADDDASGVAAVLAAARVMSTRRFPHTIQFIVFSGEEVGTYGSFMYAKMAHARGDNIIAVINADMVGYADTEKGGDMIRMFQASRAEWIGEFARDVSEKYWEDLSMAVQAIPNYRGADHQAFLEYGYDAVFFAHYDGYPWGNSVEDTPDHVNHTYQVKATKYLLALVAELAYQPLDFQIIIKSPLEGYAYVFNYPVFPFHWGRFYSMEIRGSTLIVGRCDVMVDVRSKEDIEFVIFCLDDIFISWDRNPPYQWEIQGKQYPPLGKHTLRVFAYDTMGNIVQDEMDIIIFTASYQYAPWQR